MIKEWPEINLSIKEVHNGLEISQNEDRYCARFWTLSEDVVKTIELAIANGLTCLIRNNHPSPRNHLSTENGVSNSVQYLGFSRKPEERWIFVIDQFSSSASGERSKIKRITFEKHYQSVLDEAKISWKQEARGGKNLFVDFEYLEKSLLSCTLPGVIDSIEKLIKDGKKRNKKQKSD